MSKTVHASKLPTILLGMMCLLAPQAVRGQIAGPPEAEEGAVQTPRFGVTLVDLGSGQTGTPALELTRLYETPLFWRVGVGAGLTASFRGAVYGYGGFHLPVYLPAGIVARPSVSLGLYEGGTGMDLGHAIQFRSGIVLERRVSNRLLLSALLYHMSNAGLGRRNPGMEGLGIGVTYIANGAETERRP